MNLPRDAFDRIMQRLLDVYPNRKLNKHQLETWFLVMRDMTEEQLQAAVLLHIRNGDDWPTPAKLRQNIGLVDPGMADPETRAIKAWDAVSRAIKSVGGYTSVDFDDPLTNASVRSLGGWEWLTNLTSDELKFKRHEFLKTYKTFSVTGVVGDLCRPLAGIEDRTNERIPTQPRRIEVGLPAPQPQLIRGPVQKRVENRPNAAVSRLAIASGVE